MMRKLSTLILILSLFLGKISATTTFYKGAGGKITSGVFFSLKLSGISHKVINDTFGIEAICIKVSHKDISKLAFYLYAPDGTFITLSANNGSGKLYDSTFFSDTGTVLIKLGTAPFRGNYKPETTLKSVNNKQNPNGTWKLYVTDTYTPSGSGSLIAWYIVVGSHPSADVRLFSSNLPIININTRGQTIYPRYKQNVKFDVIDNGPGKRNFLRDSLKFRGYAGMGIHGHSSASFPKKSYGIGILDSNWVQKDTPLLGMPTNSDWVLLANYTDKSLLRNYLVYKYSRDMGHYAARSRFAEVVIDGVYQGEFLVVEKIKRSKNRLNISKLLPTDTAGVNLTGGYIMKIDWVDGSPSGWTSPYPPVNTNGGANTIYIQAYSPSILAPQQLNYIQNYIDSFEYRLKSTNYQDTLKGWRPYCYESDAIDYFISSELCRDVDGYRLSAYFYKDRDSKGGKLHLQPVWDYDLAWGNANYYNGWLTSGWAYSSTDPGDGHQPPFWWSRFVKDSTFKNNLKCRWSILRRGFLKDSLILADIDNQASTLKESETRNFNEWPTLGTYVWPEPTYPGYYSQEVANLKKWIKGRTLWLDRNIPGTCRIDYIPPVVSLKYKDTMYLEVNKHYVDSGINYSDNWGAKNCTVAVSSNLDSSTLGTYQYWYDVTDKAGNKTSVLRVIIVIDTIPPVISFAKGDTVKVEVFHAYSDSDIKFTDNYDTSLINTYSGNFNIKNILADSLGLFYMKYISKDHSGNITTRTRYILVIDTIPPVISFAKSDTIRLEVLQAYSGKDVTYKDNYDTGISILISGNFNFKNNIPDSIGLFYIKYTLSDKSKNHTSRTRYINVFDTISPKIILIGKDSVFIKQNDIYNDSGYSANDNFDKKLIIDTAGNFSNTLIPGTYTINYSAKDHSGNKSNIASRAITILQGSGIESAKVQNSRLQIYPNPNDGTFILEIKSLKPGERTHITMYDALGQKLPEMELFLTDANIKKVHFSTETKPGVYYMKLDSGSYSEVQRLIFIR